MNEPRLRITGRLRSIMSYDKLAGEVPRVLILRSQYWLDGACESAARQLGWQVASVPMAMEGTASREQIAQMLDAIVTTRPDFILSINLAGMDVDGMWARFFDDLRVPYVVWFVDNPRTIVMDRSVYASPHAVALTWDETYAAYLRDAGFSHVHWLPLAADTAHFNAPPAEAFAFPPTFVGNSMVEFADRAWRTVRDDQAIAPIAECAFAGDAVTRERLGSGLGAVIGTDTVSRLDAEQQRHLEMLFFLEGTRRLRHDHVRALTPCGLRVCGDEGWRSVVDNPLGPLNYFEELPGFYRNCPVNLNFTSLQMPAAVNQRVFDCPAAGGFLLTDAQSDIVRLFGENEVATFATLDECRDKLQFFMHESTARRAIVEAARKRILGEHTYAQRLRTIANWVMEYFT
ncbi:MAG: glycosyltransferase [Candidatus Hydrogenedentes bacterium]|nr:glycosyltransferase [Candidatus Hydrogenedentota bacterium]